MYGKKVDLGNGYWNHKRKMWVTTHFSEIIKQPFSFQIIPFWILIALAKICFFHIAINGTKMPLY